MQKLTKKKVKTIYSDKIKSGSFTDRFNLMFKERESKNYKKKLFFKNNKY